MDTELPNAVKVRRRVKNAILWTSGAAFTLLIIYGFYSFIKPSVKKSSLITAVAETGSIEATISASGLVVPMYEQIITSPVEAKIEKVFHYSGETVNPGDPILLLNNEFM